MVAARRASSISEILPEHWDALSGGKNPLLRHAFHSALEESGSVGGLAGWNPRYWTVGAQAPEAGLFAYEKTHSYGEYIFDWDWASAYESQGVPYYPKLTSMIPVTPATTPHIAMSDFKEKTADTLLNAFEEHYESGEYSSAHFLFITDREAEFFKARGYILRESFQYHFKNRGYADFGTFLDTLKSRKAKQIRKERRFPPDFRFEDLTGSALRPEHADEMYSFYRTTLGKKHGIPYLKKDFFTRLFNTMADNVLYVRACADARAVAGALYFYDDKRLYGRYWGAIAEYPCLHFELCFYRGIEFAINNKLEVFEAGAQGEHKIPRGFEPVKTYSAHKIKHPNFRTGIERYVEGEKRFIARAIAELKTRLPYVI